MRNLLLLLFAVALILPVVAFGQGCLEGGSEEGVNIVGFIQPQIEYYPRPTSEEEQFTFSFNRARLGAVGNVPYDISYYFMMEFGPLKPDSPYLLDAFITYTRLEHARISFGQFKQPLSLERNTSCSGLHTIKRSRVVDNLAMDRDIGIMVLGDIKEKVKYNIALMNGTGIHSVDDNKGKDIVGRITYTPRTCLTLGTGFAFGNSESQVAGEPDDTKRRFAGDFEVRYSDFLVQGEYIYGKDEGSYTVGGGGCGDPAEIVQGSIERQGLFLIAMYTTEWKLQPVVKYELWDTDKTVEDDIMHSHTFGFNYFINDWTRIQVNYVRNIEDFRPALNNDELLIQMQVKFQ